MGHRAEGNQILPQPTPVAMATK